MVGHHVFSLGNSIKSNDCGEGEDTCADPENFLRGIQIGIRGLTENFNMANINNLAIPGGGGGGGVWTPCPPPPPTPSPPLSGSAHGICSD